MTVDVRVEEVAAEELPPVEYRWDADTEILTGHMGGAVASEGLTGSVDIEGRDGAWITLELTHGLLCAVEIAVWPDVSSAPTLTPPAAPSPARIRVPSRSSQPDLAAVEVDTAIRAVSDAAERTIHFRIGPSRQVKALRVARDLVIEVDTRSRLAGLWLLNVPPFPTGEGLA